MEGFSFTRGPHDTGAENVRTLALLAFAYTAIFTAYMCLEVFQSSINFEDGLGTASMAALYVMFAVASIGTAPIMMEKLTAKWALMTAWFGHTLFICANAYPVWGTMIPASAVLGVMSGVVWIVQGVYFTALSRKYSSVTHQNLQVVMGRFGAVLEGAEAISQLAGSAIAVVVLRSMYYKHEDFYKESISNNGTSALDNNRSNVFTNCTDGCLDNSSCISCDDQASRDVSMCGPNHCPYLDEHTDVLVKPPPVLLYTLLAILLGCNLSGILGTCFLTNIKTKNEATVCQKYLGPVKAFANPRLYLILWSFVQSNFLFALYCGAFHQSFVSCTLGVAMVGYTFMVASASRALTAVISGKLVKYIPRVYHYTAGCVLSSVLGVTWIFWQPQPDELWVFFVMALVYGAALCLVMLHVRGLVVDVFDKHPEVGFAQKCLWDAAGSALAYGINNSFCLVTKALILIVLSVVAGGVFVSLEIMVHFSKRSAAKGREEGCEKEQRKLVLLNGLSSEKKILKIDTPEREKLKSELREVDGV